MADPSRSFKRPSVQALAEIAKDMRLTEAQTHELDLVLQDVQEDLDRYPWLRIDRTRRAEQTARLEAFRKGLSIALEAIGPEREAFTEALPFDAREVLARTLSPAFIFSVTGRRAALADPVNDLFGSLVHGRLLGAQLGPILAAIERDLAARPRDRGGREPNTVRRDLILSLADAAPNIIGRRATATANGPFVKLLDAVFQASGLSTKGLEEAAEDGLAKWREHRRQLRAAGLERAFEDMRAIDRKQRALRGAGR